MNIFNVHNDIIEQYKSYIGSFVNIADERIKEKVTESLNDNVLCPPPLIQFNPNFKYGASMGNLIQELGLHEHLRHIFHGYNLYQHQEDAIRIGQSNKDFVVTSGTGSGKSLTFLANIFDHVLKNPGKGIKAVLVYPMNALINSQEEELKKFEENCKIYADAFGISFKKYSGQENETARKLVRDELPDIILTNYMMLELIMTREGESGMRESMAKDLKFLVFDELHTYKGRQGADVAFLIRRLRANSNNDLLCIGTSATMSSGKGSIIDQKKDVAEFASKIFGKNLTEASIINETIVPLTIYNKDVENPAAFSACIEKGINDTEGEDVISQNLVVQWLEHKIGLRKDEDTYLRNKVCTLEELVDQLALLSSHSTDICRKYLLDLLQWANKINSQKRNSGDRTAYIPFRLHQFISQTGSVYVTLDTSENREITLAPGYYKPSTDESKVKIYPVMFSRLTGHDFICVRKDEQRYLLLPRDFRDIEDTEQNEEDEKIKDFNRGYIILQNNTEMDPLWSDDKISELPESWYKTDKKGEIKVNPDKRDRLPSLIYFDTYGNYRQTNFEGAISGWYMPAKLAFDPTCMAFYDLKTSESVKLAGLGNEGRSTATTTLTLASIDALKRNHVAPENQKLLSFTDNRQDASLQAGHYNDLVNVALIRSALYLALKNKTNEPLDVTNVGDEVFKMLDLSQELYAKQPATTRMASADNEKCLKDYLTIRLMQDLKRGWRFVLPNLENCALLEIDYKYLKEEATDENNWKDIPYISYMSGDERYVFLKNTLDFMRTSKAINHSFFYENRDIVENNIRERLIEEWGLDKGEKIEFPSVMRLVGLGKNLNEPTISMGAQSQWGKYVKTVVAFNKDVATFDDFCTSLFDKLKGMMYLNTRTIKGDKGSADGYLLNATCILWKAGNGEKVSVDPVRIRTNQNISLKPNTYFKQLYKNAINQFKNLKSREHTGQISSAERVIREDMFREGKLATLFCSPTMELGIDIKDLSIVHMRNVPPSPANYAQRSGRAGRSGQGALVITYCSQYSPHDRNYFNKKENMVSGVVKPPRIDITNHELAQAHINAIYLMVAGLNISNSISEIIDEDRQDLSMKSDFKKALYDGHHIRKPIVMDIVKDVLGYSPETIKEQRQLDIWIDQIPEQFNAAFDRWRKLYNQAKDMITEARAIKDNSTYAAKSNERIKAQREEKFGLNLIDSLRNDEQSSKNSSLSEFYPYRYLASEGFLPGYNFTKLPNRVMLRKGENVEFIERPRMIAVTEFGPRNIIYHNGATYEINRIIQDNNKVITADAKISKDTGYIMMGEEYHRETCPISGVTLSGQKDYVISNLIPHAFSEAVGRQKINCEEEERRRLGYKTETFFSQPSGMQSNHKLSIMGGEGDHLLNLTYMPTAKIVVVNHKWNRASGDGFLIDANSGFWKKESDKDKVSEGSLTKVKLITDYTADALYIEPIIVLGLEKEGIVTFQYALKRAIEEVFQIESNEIAVLTIGNDQKPNILVYESTEGSLGILKDLTHDISLFQLVISKAYEICHFVDGLDTRPELGPASYDDLLSYYNQRDHEIIDRHLIKDSLEKLQLCSPKVIPKNFESYDDLYKSLLGQIDETSEMERRFLKYLYEKNLRLPDGAQPSMMDIDLYIKPDFQYDGRIYVFCDGSVHDQKDVKEQDKQKRHAMRRRGIRFIEVRYDDSLDDIIAQNKDVFTKVK